MSNNSAACLFTAALLFLWLSWSLNMLLKKKIIYSESTLSSAVIQEVKRKSYCLRKLIDRICFVHLPSASTVRCTSAHTTAMPE